MNFQSASLPPNNALSSDGVQSIPESAVLAVLVGLFVQRYFVVHISERHADIADRSAQDGWKRSVS